MPIAVRDVAASVTFAAVDICTRSMQWPVVYLMHGVGLINVQRRGSIEFEHGLMSISPMRLHHFAQAESFDRYRRLASSTKAIFQPKMVRACDKPIGILWD